jgi:hypothetical protein
MRTQNRVGAHFGCSTGHVGDLALFFLRNIHVVHCFFGALDMLRVFGERAPIFFFCFVFFLFFRFSDSASDAIQIV